MNSLIGDGPDVQAFVKTDKKNIENIVWLARSPSIDIEVLLADIQKNVGISRPAAKSNSSTKYNSFENWFEDFKRQCGVYNASLAGSGADFLDFMDHEPLRRAFRDGVSPDEVASGWATTFDINTFGRG